MKTRMNKLTKWTAFALAAVMMLALVAGPVSTAFAAEAETHAAAGHGEGEEPAPQLLAPPSTGTVVTSIVTLVIFAGLLAILGKYAWGPIVAGLETRENKIRDDIEAAERARAQAENSQREYKDQMAGAEQRVRDLMAQAQADGQQLATRIKMQAQEEAEEIKERAMRDIEQSRREAVEQVRTEAATLATAVAEKILRREVNRDDQQRLIDESLNEFQTVGANA